jgi:hypothetical protein
MVWDRWSGSYRDFRAAHRIHAHTLAKRLDDTDLLRDMDESGCPRSARPMIRPNAVAPLLSMVTDPPVKNSGSRNATSSSASRTRAIPSSV